MPGEGHPRPGTAWACSSATLGGGYGLSTGSQGPTSVFPDCQGAWERRNQEDWQESQRPCLAPLMCRRRGRPELGRAPLGRVYADSWVG